MLDRVTSGRSSRIAALQNTFPQLHYVTITALTASILFVFLIETDRPVILFLDNFQLRLIWGLLVGTLTAIYCIGIDLASPFVGTYVVPADQLLDEAEDLLTLIRETFTPSPNNNVGRISDGMQSAAYPTQNTFEVDRPLSQVSAVRLDSTTNGSIPEPELPAEAQGINGGMSYATSFNDGSASPPNPIASNEEENSNTSVEQVTNYEEYMRRREQEGF
uniref:Uncharacterized protein n=1 Tax=Minutocellus polymorphus TaxID=265543 RepID=A0A7S0B1Z3_9STRA|mmetsp:Transcript_9400/g.15604  ORF Transcript_9400/g.15604 Transcript_9400/m.15604 type:complete len:219 (+) Transcript_9400:2-658(+)